MFINLNFKRIFYIFLLMSLPMVELYAVDTEQTLFKISSDSIKKEIRNFVSCCRPNRMVGSSGHLKSFNWLLERVNSLKGDDGVVHVDDFKPDIENAIQLYRSDFQKKIASRFPPQSNEYQIWNTAINDFINHLNKRKSLIGRNIIWEKKGIKKPEELIIIGAHYDTIAQNKSNQIILENESMPGADDNGSGVVIALKLIELLSEIKLDKSVMVVFFDFQELGFLGSKAFVDKYQEYWKSIKLNGFINLLMLGHDSVVSDLTKSEGNMKAYIRREGEKGHQEDFQLYKMLNRFGAKGKVNFDLLSNSFDSSDCLRFWEAGVPAIVFTQDWENDYNEKKHHTPNDFPETLNFNTMYESYLYLGRAILGWNFSS